MAAMITYSQQDMQRQIVSDQRLWKRVPVAAAALLWPLLVMVLGWQTGSVAALAAVLVLGALSVVLPPRLSLNLYLVDLLEKLLRLPLWLGWLVLAWHLSVREPLLLLLGTSIPAALGVTLVAFLLARIAVLASRFLARRVLGSTNGA
jgi:hypothetical protein